MVKFSIIIPIYNSEKFLKECLDSVINQTFKDIEIICVDDGSTDHSKEILKEYKKNDNRVKVIEQTHQGQGIARNNALEIAQGEYINFLDSDDKLSENTLDSVYKFFNKHENINIVSIPIIYLNGKDHELNYKFQLNKEIINLDANSPHNTNQNYSSTQSKPIIQTSINSTFIKKEAIKNLKFNTKLVSDEGLIFINKILLSQNKIGLVKDGKYYFRNNNENSLTNTANNKKDYYNYRLTCFKEFINYSIKENDGKNREVPKFIQCAIIYSLKSFEESPDFPKEMNEKEINEFWEDLYYILDYIDENIILNSSIIKKTYLSHFLIYLKNHKEFHIETDDKNNILLKTKNHKINNLKHHKLYFDIIELKDGFLNLSGNIVSSCDSKVISIEAIKKYKGKKEVFKGKYIEYPRTPRKTDRYLGIDWRFNYNFEFKIPISKKGNTKIKFQTVYKKNGEKIIIKNELGFRKFAEISAYSHYYIKDSQILLYGDKSFNIIPYKYIKALRLEISAIKKILTSSEKYKFTSAFYRLLYLLLLPRMKNKEIYLFMDRRDNTGDNGEHLFRYAVEQNDNIKKYFAVEKTAKTYEKLKKEYGNKILEFGSFKHKFIYMFVDKFIGSQGYKNHINPFADKNLKLTQGISSPPVYFLQHGVGKYNMTNWLRKYDINFSLLLTVSDLDQKAFIENYNYDINIIQELGFPRYDNLTKENLKKEIVIIPTWRKPLKTEYDLLSSEYYSRWNNLLNNQKLIDFAKEKGYKIVYKPHPNSMKFLNLFKTEKITVDTNRRFHDILCESALMITDYSSVPFDFAYLKKPIIYYQYGDDGNFQGEPLIDDDASTFGPIIKEEDELINRIMKYIENNCKMEEKYKEKVDKFFKYNDKNNSKRVYDWILQH